MAFLIPSMFLVLALIHLYHNWRIQPHSLYLSGAMAAMAVFFVNYYFFIYGPSVFWLAVVYGHLTPIHLLMGPLLYFYVRGVLTDSHRMSRRDLLHVVPALLDLISRIPYLVEVSWSTKLWMASEMIRDPNRLHDFSSYFFPAPRVALTLRVLSMIGYTGYCLWMVWRFQSGRKHIGQIPRKSAGIVIRFLKHMLSVCLFTELSFFTLQVIFLTNRDLTTAYIVSSPLMTLTLVGILSIPVIIQLYPEVLYGIPRWRDDKVTSGRKDSKTATSERVTQLALNTNQRGIGFSGEPDTLERFKALSSRIESTLEEQKPFLNPDFSLDDLARMMEVPKHHLYYCFNHVLQRKFTQIRAEHRIRHALRLIDEGQTREKTLEAIGMESGFSSRSSFITAFREVTGKLPREYQQTLLSPQS